MIIPDPLYSNDSGIQELFDIKYPSGFALLKLNSDSTYIINEDDLDALDIILLFFDADEC